MLDDDALTGVRKTDFTRIYREPDPRAYFRTLMPLNYQIPQQALPVFQAVLAASERTGRPRTVLDVCCSYGINAALLRCEVDLREIGARYTERTPAVLSELIDADAQFYADRRRRTDRAVFGLDVSSPAIDYGVGAGLLTGGWAEDLEASEPSTELSAGLRDVNMIISTGGVGYIGPRTFDRLVATVGDRHDLWLVIFVLRVFAYDEIAETLTRYGLVTEQVPGLTFRQRRFADTDEFDAANHDVLARGLDPTGKEADGWYHAECFISRPAAAAAQTPITDVLAELPDGDSG